MRFAYLYFMQDEPDRVRAVAPQHEAYWQAIAADGYLGGPFADRSGGLITCEASSRERAEMMAAHDPFARHGLLGRHWLKEWDVA